MERHPRQKYEGTPKERNLQAVKKYYETKHEQVLKALLLRRMRNGHQPKPRTLEKYNLLPQAE